MEPSSPSSRPIVPDSGLQRLKDEGFEVEVRQQHLLLHSVPYVTSAGTIERATLACIYVAHHSGVRPPDEHLVWWTGEFPCFANGRPIMQIGHEDVQRELFPGFTIRHRFSNKPDGVSAFPDHYAKLLHYANIIESQARAVDETIDARTLREINVESTKSPFQYADSASARAAIQTASARLGLKRVGIVGLGGTGAYVLDQVAKTPVEEIHLFDGDTFLQHNAFRSPGAASANDIDAGLPKVEYFRRMYSALHRGIVSHAESIESANVSHLADFEFVFVCVDRGGSRRLIFDFLVAQQIPFIDVGMNLHLVPGSSRLLGSLRTSLCTPDQTEHIKQYVPLDDEQDEADVYRTNIQVADMNALNAQLAVIQWKQYFGFYQDDFSAHNLTFSVSSLSLVRDVMAPRRK
jgi:hypothetical protein